MAGSIKPEKAAGGRFVDELVVGLVVDEALASGFEFVSAGQVNSSLGNGI
jgi:hypothetical protein